MQRPFNQLTMIRVGETEMMTNEEDANMVLSSAPPGEDVEILANILKHLSAEELRDARLVNCDFNEIICTHPELLWAKNRLFAHIEPTVDQNSNKVEVELKWMEFFRLDLTTRYCCPNIHFYKTNLLSPGAHKFFRSSVPPQLKHVKMTGCELKSEALLYILNRISSNLEHLELVDLSHINFKRMDQIDQSHAQLRLHSLNTVILQGHLGKSHQRQLHNTFQGASLPQTFLNCIFRGAPHLKRIAFMEWSSETCKSFIHVLSSLPLEHVEGIQNLAISCTIKDGFQYHVEKYTFLKRLEFIELPSLRKLAIRFDRELDAASGLTRVLVEDLSHTVATFLACNADNLEVLELINCPVSSDIFGRKMSSFPKLFRVNTRGSFVSELTEDEVNNNSREVEAAPEVMDSSNSEGSRLSIPLMATHPELASSVRRLEGYTIACIVVFFVLVVHLGLNFMFDKFPSIGVNLEILVYVTTVLWMSRRSELQQLCGRCSLRAFMNWFVVRPNES